MITFSHPLALLLAIPFGAGSIFLWWDGYTNLGSIRRYAALGARSALLAAVILGLAGASIASDQSHQSTVFVADLSASDQADQPPMHSLISEAEALRPRGDESGVVATSSQAVVEQAPSARSRFQGFPYTFPRGYTNLATGLDLAAAILPTNLRRRIVLMSDGQQNVGNAVSAAGELRREGIRVDVVPVQPPARPEVMVSALRVPSQLRANETFKTVVVLRSTTHTSTDFTLEVDHARVLTRHVRIKPGVTVLRFAQRPLKPGFHTYTARIDPINDTDAQNNQSNAFVSVGGAPRVLVVAANPADAVNVLQSLRSTHIRTHFSPASEAPDHLADLENYSAVVLVNTPADVLSNGFMNALVPYVRDLGHGVAVIGGNHSYGVGDYSDTPLEQILPVRMALPERRDLPSVAVAVIIESLEEPLPVDISKQAGKGVIDLLTPQDQVAVNDAPGTKASGWVVTLRHAIDKQAIKGAISRMNPGDPLSYKAYLKSAYHVLVSSHAQIKHIILLGDGDVLDGGRYKTIASEIRRGGVTISTVITNAMTPMDSNAMRQIAKYGGGRFYQANNPQAVPKIFLREARTVARASVISGKFHPRQVTASDILSGIRTLPPLYGYVATTPKAAAQIILTSPKLDPILSAWQFGLGRTVAWTSDASGLWSRRWVVGKHANRFWANLVSWTFPARPGGQLSVSLRRSQETGTISASAPSSLGGDPRLMARLVGPDSAPQSIPLQLSSTGQFVGSFAASQRGTYFANVRGVGAGRSLSGTAGLSVSYSPEYRSLGTNMQLLRSVARAGGGSIVDQPGAAWRDNLAAAYSTNSLSPWLWLLAALLLPVDVALRRLVIWPGVRKLWSRAPKHE